MSEDVLEILPLERPPQATVRVPGSKSITNRALLLASLAPGTSTLEGVLFSDDTRYMARALERLGAGVSGDEQRARIAVEGLGGSWSAREADLFLGNAGTAIRFLTAAVCLGHGRYRLDGTARMRQRPIQDLVDALAQLGAAIRCEDGTGCPPVVVAARGLRGGATRVAGSRSSQFLSALLHVAPYAERDVTITVEGPLIAGPYVDMSLGMMHAFGVGVERDGYRRFAVPAGQRYRPREYRVEPDASSASYFLAAAALTGGHVRVEGLGKSSLQGDVRFAELLAAMGAAVRWEENAIEVRGPAQLSGLDADLNALSDTAPTLAVLAPFASAPVRLRNIAHLRWQESDRLAALAAELRRLGVAVDELADGLVVHPSAVTPATVSTYDDHRLAMSFALIGLKVAGVRIRNPSCVAKTFPDYFAHLEGLRR